MKLKSVKEIMKYTAIWAFIMSMCCFVIAFLNSLPYRD